MKKERIFSIITTSYFLLYSVSLVGAEISLGYGLYILRNGAEQTGSLFAAADGILSVMFALWSMLGVFSWVALVFLVAALIIPLVLCVGIFIHSCICLKQQSTPGLERKKLKRDAIIKIIFFTCALTGILWIIYSWQAWNLFLAMLLVFGLAVPFLLSVLTLVSCTREE